MQDSLTQDDAAPAGAAEAGPRDPASRDSGPGESGFRDPAPEAGAGPEPSAEAAALAAMAAADPEAARTLQAEWGADLGAKLDLARKAARAFVSPELRRALEDSGLGDHPAMIRVAAEVGRLLGGPAAAPADAAQGLDAAALDALEAEIDQLHALQFARPQEYRSERTQRALARLYARRYGGGPAPGPLGSRP